MTSQMSWHHSAMIARQASFLSVRDMERGSAFQLNDDRSNERLSECGVCPPAHSELFKCQRDGQDFCLPIANKCDGIPHCGDYISTVVV